MLDTFWEQKDPQAKNNSKSGSSAMFLIDYL